ncbi:MAG: phage holin family protein [Fimbriimonadaceae bacterium]|nr:phage holin family protein [Fimbriimonadaceae bacterium]
MKGFVLRCLVNAGVLLVVANQIDGRGPGGRDIFEVSGFGAAVGAVLCIAVVNALLQPLASIIRALGCVFNVLTLGLFGLALSFAAYTAAFWVIGTFDPFGGFNVAGLREAAIGACWLSIANALLTPLTREPDDRDEPRRRPEERR